MAIAKAAVVGGGIIGSSWAIVYARAGVPVAIYDQAETRRARILDDIARALAHSGPLLKPGEDTRTVMDRIAITGTLEEALAGADLVHECIAEKIEAKREAFAALDALAGPTAILATATSSFPVSDIAGDLGCRARCIVAHPASPPHLMPVTEICPAPFTDPDITAATFGFMEACGQVPVLIRREVPGFVMNRMQAALLIAMLRCLNEGSISAADVDKIISQGFGLRWAFLGPFEGVDLNAPGGIREYFERYGFIFNNTARELGLREDVVTPQSIAALDSYARGQLPLSAIPDRINWRDGSMAALALLKRQRPPSA